MDSVKLLKQLAGRGGGRELPVEHGPRGGFENLAHLRVVAKPLLEAGVNAFPHPGPGLLLAAPRLGDPNFERTVVLLGHHDEGGSLGWVLNGRPLLPVHRILTDADLVPPGVVLPSTPSYAASARVGGPVMAGSVWLVFEREPSLPEYEGEHDLGASFAATGTRAGSSL